MNDSAMDNSSDRNSLDVVTGAFGFTGQHIAAWLLGEGRQVRTLTRNPERSHPLADRVEARPYRFDHPVELARSLEGATTLYNTYWVRFEREGASFDEAVANSRALFQAARRAGVRRIVHVSVTCPDIASNLPYFRGKALVEREVAGSGLGYGIVRPTVVFGEGDVMVNDVAWLLRRLPVFAFPAREPSPVRPVYVGDVARLCVEAARNADDLVVDAVGPETFDFVEFVGAIRHAVGSHSRLVPVPAPALPLLAGLVGRAVGDVVLTRDELAGLMAGLVAPQGPTTGQVPFSDWLLSHGETLGLEWASEIGRHFGPREPQPGSTCRRRPVTAAPV
ncbi:MAG: NAD(P)H-binding protein [Actinomycetota bacterium]|nr:NAD(P)H-binding protein [Actinomycetota bacterium]